MDFNGGFSYQSEILITMPHCFGSDVAPPPFSRTSLPIIEPLFRREGVDPCQIGTAAAAAAVAVAVALFSQRWTPT